MKASYTKKIYAILISLESYPSQRFIKGKTDVNNVYESLQIQGISFKNTGRGNTKIINII